jgi:sulfite exporter TauE/SafE
MMFIGQCIHDIAVSHGLIISLFLAGLFGGFTHCTGMCSPFVLAQVGSQPEIKKLRSTLLMPYHLGRMTTYVTLAVLVSSVINLAFVFSGLKALIAAPMLVLAGVIFLVNAFPQLSSFFPWVARIHVAVPYKFIASFSAKLMNNPHVLKRYGLGVLLGFMPCGLVVSALLASATAPNALQAGLAMGAFTLGTMPALFLVAFGGHALKQKYPIASARMAQGVMMISGLWLFALAGQILF